MDLQTRIKLLVELGTYIQKNGSEWQEAKLRAEQKNGWFTAEFIDQAADNIAQLFLQKEALEKWAAHYKPEDIPTVKKIGIVMAGNIPMVGFHDLLSVFISGHHQVIKLSSKDDVLIQHLQQWMATQNPTVHESIQFADSLKGMDGYIATGSNNTGKYFDLYFGKYPHIIRKNKTSVAILEGTESAADLQLLAGDIHQYFGLGCRNVTHIYVPENYNFEPLLQSFNPYLHFMDHHKYKNNYDYQLSLLLLNHQFYMTNGSSLLSENDSIFSPIGHLYYSFYKPGTDVQNISNLSTQTEGIQAIVGTQHIPFGQAQSPGLFDYADGVDTMEFLLGFRD